MGGRGGGSYTPTTHLGAVSHVYVLRRWGGCEERAQERRTGARAMGGAAHRSAGYVMGGAAHRSAGYVSSTYKGGGRIGAAFTLGGAAHRRGARRLPWE